MGGGRKEVKVSTFKGDDNDAYRVIGWTHHGDTYNIYNGMVNLVDRA